MAATATAASFRELFTAYQAQEQEGQQLSAAFIAALQSVQHFPRRKAKDSLVRERAIQLANELYPAVHPSATECSLSQVIKYDRDLATLRRAYEAWQKQVSDEADRLRLERAAAKELTFISAIKTQGPWDPASDLVKPLSATPMPVQIAERNTLQPLFEYLADPTNTAGHGVWGKEPFYGVPLLEFQKGVIYVDGRIDLCKQVLGPHLMAPLLDALMHRPEIVHLLLGNNIIGRQGIASLCSFMQRVPDRFKTLYLAGNCVTAAALQDLADVLKGNTTLTSLWLKRNPLGAASGKILAQLVLDCPNLTVLDLDQTEMGDEGVADFFRGLIAGCADDPTRKLSLKSIFLNRSDLAVEACAALQHFLSSPACQLEDLMMGINAIPLAGIHYLAQGLTANKTLKRLSLPSTGMTPEGGKAILRAAATHPALISLHLGQAFATRDVHARFNYLDDAVMKDVVALLQSPVSVMQCLTLHHCAINEASHEKVRDAAQGSSTLISFALEPLDKWPTYQNILNIKLKSQFLRNARILFDDPQLTLETLQTALIRMVKNTPAVRAIDSVYRTRDVMSARRGEEVLDKHWRFDDPTLPALDAIANGTFKGDQEAEH